MIPAERRLNYRGPFPQGAPPGLPQLRARPWIEQHEHQQQVLDASGALSWEQLGLPKEQLGIPEGTEIPISMEAEIAIREPRQGPCQGLQVNS
jgi:hypothetical protein